jgi:hypothetical protein
VIRINREEGGSCDLVDHLPAQKLDPRNHTKQYFENFGRAAFTRLSRRVASPALLGLVKRRRRIKGRFSALLFRGFSLQ